MRIAACIVFGLLAGGWAEAGRGPGCGADSGDAVALSAVAGALDGVCDCCALEGSLGPRRCARHAIRAAIRSGALRSACKGSALRAARPRCETPAACPTCATSSDCSPGQFCECSPRLCGGGGRCVVQPQMCIQVWQPMCGCDGRTYGNDCARRAASVCLDHAGICEGPAPTTTSTTLAGGCTSSSECDDGNGCTSDHCTEGRCQHDCLCLGPAGTATCCPGPAATCGLGTTTTTLPDPCGGDCRFYFTCGWPVCPDPGQPGPFGDPGVPACTSEHAGAPCGDRDATCNPGSGCGELLRCTDSDPTRQGCPISQRRYKQDIRYLSEQDAARLKTELLHYPLATYRYRGEKPDDPNRLGFIIDDVGASPAVAAGGERVDLYAYATMAVAAIQAQAREIEALRSQVNTLRRTVARMRPAPK